MKIKLLIHFLLLVLITEIGAQSSTPYIPYREGNKWGYCAPDGQILIDPIYDRVDLKATNGIRRVYQGQQVGCINSVGEIIIEPIYTIISFRPGFILCGNRTGEAYYKIRYHCYDFTGNKLLKDQVVAMNYLEDKDLYLIASHSGKRGLLRMNTENKFVLVLDTIYGNIICEEKVISCYIDGQKHLLDANDYSLIEKTSINDDVVSDVNREHPFSAHQEESETKNLAHLFEPCQDVNGNRKLIRFRYPDTKKGIPIDKIREVTSRDTLAINFTGISRIQAYRKFYFGDTTITSRYVAIISDQAGHEGLVNGLGEQVLDFEYLKIEYTGKRSDCFVNVFLCQGKNEKWGLADDDGNVLLPTEFDSITLSEERIVHPHSKITRCRVLVPAVITKIGEKFGLTSVQQQELVPHQMDSIYYDERKAIFYLQKDELWGCYSKEGSYCPPIYQTKPSNVLTIDGYTVVTFHDKNRLSSCGNTKGKIYIQE